jgi:hypothetical protein
MRDVALYPKSAIRNPQSEIAAGIGSRLKSGEETQVIEELKILMTSRLGRTVGGKARPSQSGHHRRPRQESFQHY